MGRVLVALVPAREPARLLEPGGREVVLDHDAAGPVRDRVPERLSAALPPGARRELVVDLELAHRAREIAVSDAEIVEGLRRRTGAARAAVVSRARFAAGGSGASFERVTLAVDGARVEAVLKAIAPDPLGPTFERRFYEELAAGVPLRVPRLLASGPLPGRSDGWLLLEPLPARAPTRLTRARLLALAADLARLHAHFLGRAPAWLPRPFGRDARASLAHVAEGAERLRARLRRRPALRFLASERTLDLALRLAADPAPLVRACALAPETLVHRDLHHHNVALGDPAGAVVFDWEAVAAGPPVFDLALLHAYAPSQVLAPATAGRLYVRRARALAFGPLLERYLDALREAAPGLDVEAVRAAVPAAFAWEAVHRIGWIDGQLDGLARGAAVAARVPLLRRVEGRRLGPVMLGVWRELFAGLEACAEALGAD